MTELKPDAGSMHAGRLDPTRVSITDPGADLLTVKVWELPVRLTHWVIFFAVVVLAVTGYYIGRPFMSTGSDPQFLMGKMRVVHFVAAWIFSIAVVARIVWAFLGNHWARWRQFVPIDRHRRYWARETFKFYTFIRREPPPAVGHNPLAGLTYLVVYLMFLFQIVSGFGLLSISEQSGWQWWISGWIFSVASPQVIRLGHHLVMWLTIGFLIHHLFSALLVDMEERSGLVSSIITGWKRIPRERL
jgi:Ni/Fe-hydrogenase 1 B-type cytochrome subunit